MVRAASAPVNASAGTANQKRTAMLSAPPVRRTGSFGFLAGGRRRRIRRERLHRRNEGTEANGVSGPKDTKVHEHHEIAPSVYLRSSVTPVKPLPPSPPFPQGAQLLPRSLVRNSRPSAAVAMALVAVGARTAITSTGCGNATSAHVLPPSVERSSRPGGTIRQRIVPPGRLERST